MKPFSRTELSVTVVALVAIIGLSLFNFKQAIRRSRDNVRKDDITYMRNQLLTFRDEAGYIPLSTDDGRMKACAPPNISTLREQLENNEITMKDYLSSLEPCEWGNSKLIDLVTETYYVDNVPKDPLFEEGYAYKYISNGTFFQLYAYLEGEGEEDEISPAVAARKLECGTVICNFGKTYEQVPLDKSLEEYENELMSQSR